MIDAPLFIAFVAMGISVLAAVVAIIEASRAKAYADLIAQAEKVTEAQIIDQIRHASRSVRRP